VIVYETEVANQHGFLRGERNMDTQGFLRQRHSSPGAVDVAPQMGKHMVCVAPADFQGEISDGDDPF